ncbi:MAG: rod shape-determining protein MreD [Alphaproteobacteria bacterium]|nr:rod shape-determining protein MreD [Alphaproteobacteria bacterium]
MLPTIAQKADFVARRLLPLATTFLFVLAGVVAWPLPHLGAVTPALGMIAVYYWSIHRPDLLSLLAVFLFGLLGDAMNGLPMGLTALVYVAMRQLVLSQRRFFVGQDFYMLWSGFALVMIISMVCHWIVLSLYFSSLMAFFPVLIQSMLTIVLFPLPVWVLIRLQRLIQS